VQIWEISPDLSQVDPSAQSADQWAATSRRPHERAMRPVERPVESGSGKCERQCEKGTLRGSPHEVYYVDGGRSRSKELGGVFRLVFRVVF
jgi:hypothetical protein